jgi:hypothetical protein
VEVVANLVWSALQFGVISGLWYGPALLRKAQISICYK